MIPFPFIDFPCIRSYRERNRKRRKLRRSQTQTRELDLLEDRREMCLPYGYYGSGYPTFTPRYISVNDLPKTSTSLGRRRSQPNLAAFANWYNPLPSYPATPYAPPITQPYYSYLNPTPYSITRSLPSLHYAILPSPEGKIKRISSQLYNSTSHYPHLKWDIAQMPSMASRCRLRGEYIAPGFDSTAVRPQRSALLIHSGQQGLYDYFCLWGPIRVTRVDGGPVTVEDVMNSIFDYFQMPLAQYQVYTAAEWVGVLGSYKERIAKSPNSYAAHYEKHRGPLRIDLLSAFSGTQFAGLRLYPGGGGVGVDGLLLSVRV
ncbi:hypothetical protein DFP72DRAFT_1179225 [Ephemerocybe angulata]|uniref:DUF6699 domain-containing protein n=1 Tax=Ephemerocybe angulata TaxID=980116 RepID=A0A8H6HAV2_9AGAR|nr:hypothetical protein DFP72DRAFT_1179225 [Tulosesus angulatus]